MYRSSLPLSSPLALLGLGMLCLPLLLPGCRSRQAAAPMDAPWSLTSSYPLGQMLPLSPGQAALPLQAVRVEADLTGTLARVTLDLTFFNPGTEALEAEWRFPLAPQQVLTHFALETSQGWQAAVVVPKRKAREAFETIKRAGEDPGLVEQLDGNTFRVRVFPVPARGSRRLRLSYEEPLTRQPAQPTFLLPWQLKDSLQHWSYRLRTHGLAEAPTPLPASIPLQFVRQGGNWIAQDSGQSALPQAGIGLRLPPSAPKIPRAYWGKHDSGYYFWLEPTAFDAPPLARPAPRRLGLFWDVSASAARRDQSRELDLLGRWLGEMDSVTVVLQPFHLRNLAPQEFVVKRGKWQALRQAIESLPPDGATRAPAWQLPGEAVDACLLVSDGFFAFPQASDSLPAVPVHVLHAAPAAAQDRLRGIATRSGGAYVDLSNQSPGSGLAALTRYQAQLLGLSEPVAGIRELEKGMLPGGTALHFAGRWDGEPALLRLRLGAAGSGSFREEAVQLAQDPALELPGEQVARRWAQWRAQRLQEAPVPDLPALEALGTAYGLVTPATSLLVLERLADYLRFRVPPPAPMRSEYERLLAQEKAREEISLLSHVDQVAEGFAARKAWWAQSFEMPDEPYEPGPVRDKQPVARPDGDRPLPGGSLLALGPGEQPQWLTLAREVDTLRLQVQDPAAPYLDSLRAQLNSGLYGCYLRQREAFGRSPAFYVEVGDYLFRRGEPTLATRVLSNLAELDPQQVAWLRLLAYRLQHWGADSLALHVLGRIEGLRPEEPQSLRDLARAYTRLEAWQAAVDHYWDLIRQPWPDRFPGIGVLAAHELNALLGRCPVRPDLSAIDPRLLAPMPLDLRVALQWDSDAVDLDLWVTDPRGEKCYYQHPRTAAGGWLPADVQAGYGPEEFILKAAAPGTYRIAVNYYANRRPLLTGPATLRVEVIRDYGLPSEVREATMLRLGPEDGVIEVGVWEK